MKHFKVIILFFILIIFVVILSKTSNELWVEKREKILNISEFIIYENMSLDEFGEKKKIPNEVISKVFKIQTKYDFEKDINSFNINIDQIKTEINKNLAIYSENQSKNWLKIYLKFFLWFIFLIFIFIITKKSLVNSKNRKWLYLISIVIFGVVMGSDPSPMGTIKDAIVLFGKSNVVFIPRIIALIIFLSLVILANKFICSWGCQFGVLQDFIFRINKTKKQNNSIFKQFKIPFIVTNSIRILFFLIFSVIAIAWAFDIIEWYDPFKIFNPTVIDVISYIFIPTILVLSLFVYRPWCHLFCPFGLIGWLAEKISIFKIKVNYETCIGCEACVKSCPSNVMSTILKRDKIIPDCFACSSCINVCPTNSIKFDTGKREKPPDGKFEN
ncbi:MAG: 4Fe-4S binding protein [Ignavibacteriales bacterium]|nr:4Fe-4S binding protein [Ignavibacteriales bacterium]